ncbi:MAG: glycosyltransferase family 4 protein [Dehalococcoidia bacterium]
MNARGSNLTVVKIAQVTSIYIPVPPPTHGGTEMMVHALTQGLTQRGHDVHLYASGDSAAPGTLHPVVERATLTDPDVTLYMDKELETRNVFELYREADGYDVVHGHWPTLAPYFSSHTRTPTVLTYHYVERAEHEYYRANMPSVVPVCVSKRQAELLGEPSLPVVYNGLDMDRIPLGESPEDYLVLVGRIVPTKGIAEAIRIARLAGERLVIVGPVTHYIPWSKRYFEEEVRPHVDGDRVRYVPEAPNAEVLDLVSRAKGFLFPLQADEPFGLSVLEAMACGTPVVTMPKGAMPELVEDGTSGFLVESDAEAVSALARISSLDRRQVRAHVESRFTVDHMVDAYEKLYAGTR